MSDFINSKNISKLFLGNNNENVPSYFQPVIFYNYTVGKVIKKRETAQFYCDCIFSKSEDAVKYFGVFLKELQDKKLIPNNLTNDMIEAQLLFGVKNLFIKKIYYEEEG